MEIPQNPSQISHEVSDRYTQDLITVWGNPERVAEAAINEAFRAGAALDFDDQISLAIRTGILAGASHEAGVDPEVFTHYFIDDVLAGYLE